MDLLCGSIMGVVGPLILFMSVFAVIKGKAGAADALLETSIFI